jgi:hypothetical protein
MGPFIIKPPPKYQSYMLRCLQTRSEDPGQPAIWRFSLEDPQTGEKHHIPDLETLVTFLQDKLEHK